LIQRLCVLVLVIYFLEDAATSELYTVMIVGSVRCV